MVDRTELQNKARLVESHRQHLEELQRRMEQIVGVINEHHRNPYLTKRQENLSLHLIHNLCCLRSVCEVTQVTMCLVLILV